MTQVPIKRFIFKCYRLVEDRRHRTDAIVVIMASQSIEDPTSCAANVDPVMGQGPDVSSEVEADTAISFKEEYVKSI